MECGEISGITKQSLLAGSQSSLAAVLEKHLEGTSGRQPGMDARVRVLVCVCMCVGASVCRSACGKEFPHASYSPQGGGTGRTPGERRGSF